MGLNNSKLECIWLPGQSGKTRNMMERIKTLEEVAAEEYECDGFLNIVISANNRALVDQTEVRMNKELFTDDDEENEEADSKIEGSCFKWRSGLKNNNITVGDLADKVKEDEVTMVVCCAHAKRLAYLFHLLSNLEKSRLFKKRINVWIDEADASIKLWSKESLNITSFSKVNKVTLVSATYDSILKKFGKIRVLPCLETMLPIYHRVQDCLIVEEDIAALSAPEYLMRIINRHKDELVKPGVRLFAPGDVERATHESIAGFLIELGFAVVIINGLRKELIIPGREKPIPLAPYVDVETGAPEEVGKVIAKIYHDNGLSEFPFAITGHLCLGRGITFQNDRFLFTHGILFNISDKANAYQTACRLAGNIKGLPDYAPPMLFTTTKMIEVIMTKENTAIDIARHVAENELTHVDREMIQYLYGGGKKPLREEDFHQEWHPFSSFDEAKDFAPHIQEKSKNSDGFFQSTYDTPKPEVMTDEHLQRMMKGKITAGMPAINMRDVGKESHRLYVIYSDVTDINSATFWVRHLKRVKVSPF
jgi:hypothetical protein